MISDMKGKIGFVLCQLGAHTKLMEEKQEQI